MPTPFDSPRRGANAPLPTPPPEVAPAKPAPEPADLALCRSALYEALALGFRPPAPETVTRLASREGAGALADASAVLDEAWGIELSSHVRRLGGFCDLEALAASFQRLFGHTARGLVPPYETEYGDDSLFQPMHEMSDLAAFYRAFGLTLAPMAHERLDHVSCECEFLMCLTRKQAYALEQDDLVMLDDTRRAVRLFLSDHLGRWAPGFGRTLAREDPRGFFGALGSLCVEFISHECAEVGVTAVPEFVRLRSAAPADLPMACGPATELLQITLPSSRRDAR
ncbi:MAG: molecular chaperone [Candidatus Methylomirabilia bacterium]